MTNGSEVGAIVANSQLNIQTGAGKVTQFYTGGVQTLQISPSGYVGIGTLLPDERLTVYGNIHARGVKVDLNGPLADYVFNRDYKLTSLNEVSLYVNKYHHLEDIPSAADVEKNGLNLGEMNQKLLKKVEELTLYLIKQDQNQQKQLHINKGLQEQITKLKFKLRNTK